jgi:hypothetical protein
MLPQWVSCEECGEKSVVRGYGRVEFDWGTSSEDGPGGRHTTPHLRSIRLTIDCPHCGVNVQDYYPDGRPTSRAGTPALELLRRLKQASTSRS